MKHTEVAVIGGGIVGCAVAYYTAKRGVAVTIIEKDELASGTSSHCDGNILAIDKDPGFDSQMSLKSQELVDQLAKELSLEFEYRQPGSILVCETDDEMEAAEKWVKMQKEAGLPFRMLDRSDLRQESKYLADDLPGGLECASDSTVNPYMLTYALFEEAKTYGVSFLKKTTVMNINFVNNQYLIETDQGSVTAKYVVNCGGVWAPKIGEMLEIPIPIFPRKGHLLVASRQVPVSPRKVMEFGYLMSKFGGKRQVDAETERYGVALVFEPTQSQNFLLGSSREFAGFDIDVNWDVVTCMAKRGIRFYPKMSDMNVIRMYAGLRPWTKDHLPIVSKVDKYPGYYIAAGHEGDGISLAAITGKVISEMISGDKTSIETDPLRYDRFNKEVYV
ncbi:sarcosine oxidase subunit beta [Scopulibacillus darangshiensis]|uniref:Aerobic glycerol-3-phosphate dehydrogenase n=1 Tax=Scopulibacillus darangshiensis TaxID=442528 RepID=A0A4R2NNZ9_9BACL|nr:FAD-dependent oxidoreductase [Scopulibacillus darangshiensis]TCP23447.1 sarcosine oxidase subunit beta [Scopulibacillus darangshiensis]